MSARSRRIPIRRQALQAYQGVLSTNAACEAGTTHHCHSERSRREPMHSAPSPRSHSRRCFVIPSEVEEPAVSLPPPPNPYSTRYSLRTTSPSNTHPYTQDNSSHTA